MSNDDGDDRDNDAPSGDMVPDELDLSRLPEVLNADHIAKVFDLNRVVARRWLARGVLPSRKIGKRRYVRRQDLIDALSPESGEWNDWAR